MTKISLPDVLPDDGTRMVALSTPAHPQITTPMAAPRASHQDVQDVKPLTLEALTGMKIIQPMRIHRYRRG